MCCTSGVNCLSTPSPCRANSKPPRSTVQQLWRWVDVSSSLEGSGICPRVCACTGCAQGVQGSGICPWVCMMWGRHKLCGTHLFYCHTFSSVTGPDHYQISARADRRVSPRASQLRRVKHSTETWDAGVSHTYLQIASMRWLAALKSVTYTSASRQYLQQAQARTQQQALPILHVADMVQRTATQRACSEGSRACSEGMQ